MDSMIKNLDILQNSIVPKFLNLFNDENKRNRIEGHFSTLFPKEIIDLNKEEYLDIRSLSKEEIIKNSIQYSNVDIDEEGIDYLVKYFAILLHNPKLRVDTNSNTAIYLELLQILNYVKKIQKLIHVHPKNYSNHHGTKYRSSSEKNLIKSHLLHLQERLDNPFFKFDNPEMIKMTENQISIIKIFQTKEHKYLPNSLNWAESFLGLDNKILNLKPEELKVLRQVLSLFNGIRTTKEAYIKSFMIFISIQCKMNTDNNKMNTLYADSILEIAKYFFNDIFIQDAKKKRKTLNFTENNLIKVWYTKTIINEVPIFAYVNGSQEDFLIKQARAGLADMMKTPSLDIFEKETSDILIIGPLKNLYRALEEFNFNKKDTRVLIELSQFMDKQSLLQDNSSVLIIK